MAEQTFELDQFRQGDFLIWSVCTQTRYTSTTTMKIGNKAVFEANKTGENSYLMLIKQGSYDYNESDVPKITVVVPNSKKIKSSIVSGSIVGKNARSVGYSYSICVEDSNDNDYNDVYINVTGWRNKG